MIFSPHFHFKAFLEKERERERERARAREEKKPNSQSISRRRRSSVRASGGADQQSELQAAPSRKDRREDRDLAPSRHRDLRSRSRDRAVASSRLRSRLTARDRAVTRSRSQIDREITPTRARAVDREIAPISRSLMIFFLGLCFPSSFPNTRKYFRENF